MDIDIYISSETWIESKEIFLALFKWWQRRKRYLDTFIQKKFSSSLSFLQFKIVDLLYPEYFKNHSLKFHEYSNSEFFEVNKNGLQDLVKEFSSQIRLNSVKSLNESQIIALFENAREDSWLQEYLFFITLFYLQNKIRQDEDRLLLEFVYTSKYVAKNKAKVVDKDELIIPLSVYLSSIEYLESYKIYIHKDLKTKIRKSVIRYLESVWMEFSYFATTKELSLNNKQSIFIFPKNREGVQVPSFSNPNYLIILI